MKRIAVTIEPFMQLKYLLIIGRLPSMDKIEHAKWRGLTKIQMNKLGGDDDG